MPKKASWLCASSQKHPHYCYGRFNLTRLARCEWKIAVIKSLIIGIFVGIAAGAAAIYFVPVVDQARERSIIEVTPNGGNREVFHVNIPDDRIVVGLPNQAEPIPRGLEWPNDQLFADTRTELFKIRDAKDIVIGVASRIAATGEDNAIVEWTFHMPARGSGYILMSPKAEEQPFRNGVLRSGTREFANRVGDVTERWVVDERSADDSPAGRIELSTRFVALFEDES